MWFEITCDENDEWHWRLVAGNGKIISVCPESYGTKAECLYSVAQAMSAKGIGVREVKPRANAAIGDLIRLRTGR